MYNTATQTYLNSIQDAPAGFWVPFTTTVPAVGAWEESTVTIYVPTADYDWDNVVWRQASNPYSKRLYNGIELAFDKRYANGWALGGSITLAKSKSITPYDPNYVVNGWGADINDIPMAIKLFGSFQMPLDFIGSFIYRHIEGGPLNYGGNFWDKSMDVTVYVPDDWLAENNCVTWCELDRRPAGAQRHAPAGLLGQRRFPVGEGLHVPLRDGLRLRGRVQPARQQVRLLRPEPGRRLVSGRREHHLRDPRARLQLPEGHERLRSQDLQALGPRHFLIASSRTGEGPGPSPVFLRAGRA